MFRGCAGARYDHGTVCKREMQTVEVEPGQPRVEVEVYLCYCTGEECNKTDIGAASHLTQGRALSLSLVVALLNILP